MLKRREIRIGEHLIHDDHPCFVIAEIGINHNGDLNTAFDMIEAAAIAGADCVKFQAFKADNFCSGADDEFEYISQGEIVKESMLDLFTRHEFGPEEFKALFARSYELGVIPLATPCDMESVDMLDGLGSLAFKIGSDDLVYPDLLKYAAEKQKPLIISTGMGDEDEITRAIGAIQSTGNNQIVLLHCVSVYPTPVEQLNLAKISQLLEAYDFPIGFSDHSDGVTAAIGARAMGALVIEKHFTLDRSMDGPDHRFSSDPQELENMVRALRVIDQGMGSGELAPSTGEVEMRKLARRSIVAARDIEKNHPISLEDLAYLRPGTGLLPYERDQIIGKRTLCKIKAGTQLHLDHLK